MVFWVELELHHVADGRLDVVWGEFCRAIATAYCDDMDGLGKCTANAQGGQRQCRELHLDGLRTGNNDRIRRLALGS